MGTGQRGDALCLHRLTILLGCAIGALNGFFIGKLRMAPFIVTLAMMSVAQGITYLVPGAQFRMKNEILSARALTWFAARSSRHAGACLCHTGNNSCPLVCYALYALWAYLAVSNESAVRLAGYQCDKI